MKTKDGVNKVMKTKNGVSKVMKTKDGVSKVMKTKDDVRKVMKTKDGVSKVMKTKEKTKTIYYLNVKLTQIKHLSVSLIADITFIQARQAKSEEPKASKILSWRDLIKVIEVIKLLDKCLITHCLATKIIYNTDL